jgi:hypothetical protein
MHMNEALRRLEAVAGCERQSLLCLDSDARAAGDGGYRQRHELGTRLGVAHGEACIASPYIDDGCTTAIVGSVHAHEVLLAKSGSDRLHPIATVLMGCAGE